MSSPNPYPAPGPIPPGYCQLLGGVGHIVDALALTSYPAHGCWVMGHDGINVWRWHAPEWVLRLVELFARANWDDDWQERQKLFIQAVELIGQKPRLLPALETTVALVRDGDVAANAATIRDWMDAQKRGRR